MDTHWKGAIEKTLRSTEATLRRLQERQAHYNVAKMKVEEALGDSRVPPSHARRAEGQHIYTEPASFHSAMNSDFAIPPPLPASYNIGVQQMSPHTPEPINHSALTGPSVSATVKEMYEANQVLTYRVKSLAAELELERTVRTDSMREFATHHANQVGELQSLLQQMRDEYTSLRSSVKSLESQSFWHPSGAEDSINRRNNTTTALWEAKSALLNNSLESASAVAAAASLSQRVADLEANVARQQRLLENRQLRLDDILRDLVSAKVDVEVERVRSIARESAGDQIERRLSAVQSSLSQELHSAVERAVAAEEVSREGERTARRMEKEVMRQCESLEDDVRSLRTAVAAVQPQGWADTVAGLKESADTLERQLRTCQLEMQQSSLCLTQSVNAKMEATRVEVLSATTRLVEDFHHRMGAVRQADVSRLIEAAVEPLHVEVRRLQQTARGHQQSLDTWQMDGSSRLTDVENSTTRLREQSQSLREASTAQQITVENLKTAVDQMCIQLRQCTKTVEDAQRTATDVAAASRAVTAAQTEFIAKTEAQLGGVKLSIESYDGHLRSAASARAGVEARLAMTESSVTALETSIPRALHPVTAKVEALSSTLNESVLPKIDTLQNALQSVSTRYQVVQESKAFQDKLVAQQLSDFMQESDTRLRNTEHLLRRERDELQAGLEGQLEAQTKKLVSIGKTVATLQAAQDALEGGNERTEAKLRNLEDRMGIRQHHHDDTSERAPPVGSTPPATVCPSADASPVATLPVEVAQQEDEGSMSTKLEAVVTADVKGLDVLEARLSLLEEEMRRVVEDLERTRATSEVQARQHSQLLHQKLSDIGAQLKWQDTALRDQLSMASERMDELAAHQTSSLQANTDRMKELMAPVRLVNAIATTEPALMQLAASVQPHLDTVDALQEAFNVTRVALKRIELSQAQLQASLEANSATLGGDAEARVAAATAEGGGKSSTAQSPTALLRSPWEERCEGLASQLEALQEKQRQGLQNVQQQLHCVRSTVDERAATVTEAVVPLQLKISALEVECRSLVEAYSAVNTTIHQNNSTTRDWWLAEQESALQPILNKHRLLEERFQASNDTLDAIGRDLHSTRINCDRLQQQCSEHTIIIEDTKVRLQALPEQIIKAHIHPLAALLEKQKIALDSAAADRVRVEKDLSDRLSSGIERMEATIEEVKRERCEHTASPNTLTTSEVAAPLQSIDLEEQHITLASASLETLERLEEIIDRVDELERHLQNLEVGSELSVSATADTLTGLHDGLQKCVARVSEHLRRHPWLAAEERYSTASPAAVSDAPHGVEVASAAALPVHLESLDDILVLFLHFFGDVHLGMRTLQQNAIATLDIIQQQEMDAQIIPALQHAVLHLAETMKPVVASVGLDPSTLSVDVAPITVTDDAE